MNSASTYQAPEVVQLEIKIEKLEALFNKGELNAVDVRCLNCISKKCLWNLCLRTCAKRMQADKAVLLSSVYCEQSAARSGNGLPLKVEIKKNQLHYF